MRQRNKVSGEPSTSSGEIEGSTDAKEGLKSEIRVEAPKRSGYVMLALFGLMMYSSWTVYYYQYLVLPVPKTADQAGKRGFSEFEAMEHVKALAGLGPHPVGSTALDRALLYVLVAAEKIKNTSHWEVDVEVEEFHVNDGANRLQGGLFRGKTLIYADLDHILLRITPKFAAEAKDNSILVSSHIDSVFSTGGAGDCSSCVAVMLELARGVSQWAHSFKSSVIFLLNTGEEEGLNGAHSFITQHPWSETVRVAIDLEAMGIGGTSGIFQAGPHPWAFEKFASVAKYPSGNIMGQDLFSSGFIISATDFQVYKDAAGLSGLDFAYSDNTAVYHTKHLGENMLAFLLEAASSPSLAKDNGHEAAAHTDQDSAIYFDILGTYMVVYRQHFANMLHSSVLMQSLLIWIMSLVMGGYVATISLALSCLSVILMWVLSIGFSVLVAFILPILSLAPVPYIASPWLVVGLFGFPSLLGALTGQHLGFVLLRKNLFHTYTKEKRTSFPSSQASLAMLEAERWHFKAGTMQWLIILMLSHYYKVGSSYIPLLWLVTPSFSYGLLEATLSPIRLPKPLKIATLLIALSVPMVASAGAIVRVIGVLIGTAVRFDRDPGATPEWLVNVIVSVVVAAVVCLTMVYLLSYLHLSGAKKPIILVSCFLFGLSLAAIVSNTVPSYTEETARALNVVHVVDTMESHGKVEDYTSYVSLFSFTPGNLEREVQQIKESFECGRQKPVDFVTFSMKYGCWTSNDSESGWNPSEVPALKIKHDSKVDERVTEVSIDTKGSTRWSLAVNTDLISDFEFRVSSDEEKLVPAGEKSSIGGWHVIQFSGGRNAPRKFDLTLEWVKNITHSSGQASQDKKKYLVKLRTDIDRVTPQVERVLKKLPFWCSLFGKSTSPFTLAFLSAIPIEF
ncbi:uncharacterized protein LOC141633258 isoform X2 [Silene latifolia]|uniref:uncharacterized protein LOC141633258 isoform X2 n=1 Tax=Silene latifolia TaxID=37657 RepID=UPI003D777026